MKISHSTACGDTYSYEAEVKSTVTAVLDTCKKLFDKDAESSAEHLTDGECRRDFDVRFWSGS